MTPELSRGAASRGRYRSAVDLPGTSGELSGVTPRASRLALAAVVLLAACSRGPQTSPEPTASSPEPTGSSPLSRPTPATSDASPAGEAVELAVVSLPSEVGGARFATWTAAGDGIVLSGRLPGHDSDQILVVAEDGTNLRCVSCNATAATGVDRAAPLLKPLPFPDGVRVLVRIGEQSPIRPSNHGVLECFPSVAECASARLVPIDPPAAGDPSVVQDERELRLAPDGQTIGLTQVRRRADGDSALVSIVGRLRREGGDADGRYVVDDARVISDLGELKGFTPDGRAALVAAFTTLLDRAANPDVVRVELASGAVSDLTVADGYDEDVALSPDQRSYVVASGRGSGLYETVSQLHRPNLLGPGLEPLTAYLFSAHRGDLLEPWLVPVEAEAGGALGQPLDPDAPAEGWDGRTLIRWHPSGDRVIWWEGRGDAFAAPEAGSTRVVVAHLTDRAPQEPRQPQRTSVGAWAPALAGYVPPKWEPPRSRDGQISGAVTVTQTTDGESTSIEVRYRDFADVSGWVIDGVEAATFSRGLLGATHYTAELTLSGDHDGWLRADARISAVGLEGSISSSVDGRALALPA